MLFHSSHCYESFIKSCSLLVFELFRSNKHIIVLETWEECVPASHCSSLSFQGPFAFSWGSVIPIWRKFKRNIVFFFKEDVDDLQCWYVDINSFLTDSWLWGCVVRHNKYFAFFFLVFLTHIQNVSGTGSLLSPFTFILISSDGETWGMRKKICATSIFYSLS